MGAAALGAGAIVAASAGTAWADDKSGSDPTGSGPAATADAVMGTPHGGKLIASVFGTGDNSSGVGVAKITLSITGAPAAVTTYCIDIKTNLKRGKPYQEGNWDTANPGSDMPHILWVLDHSVPNVDPATVAKNAGVTLPGNAANVVYVATQAAVWHFSDGFDLDMTKPVDKFRPAQTAAVKGIYSFLTDLKNNTGMTEPAPTLAITPASLTGEVGKGIGPFTVKTTAKTISLMPSEGAKLLDSTGKAVSSAVNGDTFSVLLDKPGKATVKATGTGSIPTGRIFVLASNPSGGQKVVIAQPMPVNVSAEVSVQANLVAPSASPTPSATPSPRPRPQLASTGASPWGKVAIGVVLLVAGTGITLLARKRRTA